MMLEEGLQRGAVHEEEVMAVVMLVVAVGVVTLCGPPKKGLHTWLLQSVDMCVHNYRTNSKQLHILNVLYEKPEQSYELDAPYTPMCNNYKSYVAN